jgi:hypothetical protein
MWTFTQHDTPVVHTTINMLSPSQKKKQHLFKCYFIFFLTSHSLNTMIQLYFMLYSREEIRKERKNRKESTLIYTQTYNK